MKILGAIALSAGIVGLAGTYWLVPTFLSEYSTSLRWCGALVAAGGGLLGASRIHSSRLARVAMVGAVALGITAVGVLVEANVVGRLWVQAVTRFS